MIQLAIALFALRPGFGAAEGWIVLTGAEIKTALEARKLKYGNDWRDFRALGRTLYNAGRDRRGYWNVRDDQYCGMWRPTGIWACNALERQGDRLRFVGESGDVPEAIYAD